VCIGDVTFVASFPKIALTRAEVSHCGGGLEDDSDTDDDVDDDAVVAVDGVRESDDVSEEANDTDESFFISGTEEGDASFFSNSS
jgi:hypothetical protein